MVNLKNVECDSIFWKNIIADIDNSTPKLIFARLTTVPDWIGNPLTESTYELRNWRVVLLEASKLWIILCASRGVPIEKCESHRNNRD